MPTYPNQTLLSELADARPEGGVVSLYVDTDPRKPENNSDSPAWLTELRNGLRSVGEAIDEQGDRDTVLAWREASGRIEERIRDLSPSERARSLALFTTLDGSWEHLVNSQLPLSSVGGYWDDRPHIAQLSSLVSRGRPIGIVTVDGDEMAMLVWADGRIADPEETGVESDLDGFRAGILKGEGGHGARLRTHEQQVDSRADEHGKKFLADAAAQVARGISQYDVDSIIIVHGTGVLKDFQENLPNDVADKVIATIEANVSGVDANTLADRLADDIDEVVRKRGEKVAADALEATAAGQTAVADAPQVLRALAEHRVSDLIMVPGVELDASKVGPLAKSFLEGVPDDLMVERVIEQAIAGGATLTVADSDDLREAGGVAAQLRW